MVENVQSDSRLTPSEKAQYSQFECASIVRVRLISKDRFVAALLLSDDKPRSWRQDILELLEEVAERAQAAIERAQAQEALQAAHRQLLTED